MKDIQWSFISLAISSLSHLLLRIVLGKELGPQGLGVYTLVFTIYMFGMQFSGFGIGSALTKYVAQFTDDENRIKDYISAGLSGSLITGTIMAILFYLSADLIAISIFDIPEMGPYLKYVAFCLPFIAIEKMVLGTLVGLRRMRLYALINIFQNAFIFILSVHLVANIGVRGAILGLVIPTILTGLASFFFIKGICTGLSFSEKFREVAWFGFYYVLSNTIGMINTQVDSLMVGHFLDAENVGIYAVAVLLTQSITLIPNSVHTVIEPSVAYHYGRSDYKRTTDLIKKTMLKTFLIILSIAVILTILGRPLITILFTEQFISAYTPMLILLAGYAIYSTVHSVDCTLPAIGKVNIVYKISLSCAICNILLNFVLIPEYGIYGAALATTITIILMSLLKFYFIRLYVLKKELN